MSIPDWVLPGARCKLSRATVEPSYTGQPAKVAGEVKGMPVFADDGVVRVQVLAVGELHFVSCDELEQA